MEMRWEEFWWNHITGPHVVVSDVAKALLENKMVVLKVPTDIPWRHAMRSVIQTTFRERSSLTDVVIEPIDVRDDNPEHQEPGRFILERFASSVICRGYREKSKISIQEYISAKNVIRNRILWIKGLDRKTEEEWLKFCRGFSGRTAEAGLFVLEIHSEIAVAESNALRVVNFSECVSNYDVQLFNSFVLDDQDCYTTRWKKYISTCAADVCDVDAEVSELLLRIIDFRTDSVELGMQRIVEMPEFSRRGAGECSDHILRSYRNGDRTELEHRIWSSQVQVLFPLIELERVSYVQKYQSEIQRVLDNEDIYQFGERLSDALDTELGSLCYLMSRRNYDGLYMLYIPDEADRDRIKFLHDCRNKLAHASCCTPEQVCGLLD